MTWDVNVSSETAIPQAFLGFGAEWDPYWRAQSPMPDDGWPIVERRIAWMRLPAVRMMMLARWCWRPDGSFDLESPEMRVLYRHLDLCQRLGIRVFLTDWGIETWTHCPGLARLDEPRYAEVIGAYLEHLVRAKGYTCISHFILVNEPNYEARSGFEVWAQGVRNVAAELKRRGLDRQITMTGADTSNNLDWQRRGVDALHDVLGAYDIHGYMEDRVVRPGDLEAFWRAQRQYALEHDPHAAGKPYLVTEAGMQDDAEHPRGNRGIDTHRYGVFMADYAVQAARAGMAGVFTWMLDDTSHTGFYWGLWSNAAAGLRPRPHFYPWALLSRFVPAGATLHRVETPSPDLRLLAARTAEGGWTLVVVNRGATGAAVRFRLAGGAPAALQRYVYAADGAPCDAEGLPVSADAVRSEPAGLVTLACPPDAMALATSLRP